MSPGPRRAGRLPRRLGVLALVVLVSLLAVELAVRLLVPPPRSHGGLLELHGDLGFRGVPGTRLQRRDGRGTFEIVLGREGFRGRQPPAEPASARRVLFLGDSFLVGDGLRDEDLIPARIERALGAQGEAAEAYNLSTLDIGTGQQLLLLARYGARIAPDAVVLVMYPANDIVNDTRELAGRTRVSAGDPIRPYVVPEDGQLRRVWVHPVRGPLRSHSRLFALAERALFSFSLTGEVPPLSMAARVRNGGLPLEELELFRRHDPSAAWEVGWRRSFALLRALRDRCRALGARLLVAVVPSEHQVQRAAKVVSWDALTRSVAKIPLDTLLDWNLPEERLARFFREEGIEARLLLTPLRRARDAGQAVYARDGHLTAAGHAVAARAAAEWLAGSEPPLASEAPIGEPVRMLPRPADAPAALDFRRERQASFLGDGWLDWRGANGEGAPGWRVVDRALIVLPRRPGRLSIQGVVPDDAALPIQGQLEQLGGTSQPFQLDGVGPFELHLSPGGGRPGATADGYAVFVLDPARGSGPLASGLRLQHFGFEEAAGASRSRAGSAPSAGSAPGGPGLEPPGPARAVGGGNE